MTTARLEVEYWDKLYQQREYVYGTAPNQYLLQHVSLLQPGMTALVVGDGEGRNGVWLATRGLQVVSAERSPWGIAKALRLARHHRVQLSFECCDLLDWAWPQEQFDVAVAMYLHLRKRERKHVHRNLARCLKPGGLLLLEAFKRSRAHADNSRRSDDSLFTAAMLAQDFCGLEFIELLENTVTLDEGCMHQGCAEVIRVVAQKPLLAGI